MPKIVSIHRYTLRPGVAGTALEAFFQTVMVPMPMPEGWNMTLLKCDRGEFTGQYAIIWEIESLAARAHYYPESGEASAETEALFALQGDIWQRLALLADGGSFSDYVVVEA
jgi:hypothetical protein